MLVHQMQNHNFNYKCGYLCIRPYTVSPLSYYWIGLSTGNRTQCNMNMFNWYDGSPYNYTNWALGQPSCSWDPLNLVNMCTVYNTGGQWSQLQCAYTAGVLCQRGESSLLEPLSQFFCSYMFDRLHAQCV